MNPRGRPPVGRSLASAIRAKVSPAELVRHALRILDCEDAPPMTRIHAIEWLARCGYGAIAALGRQLAAADSSERAA